MVKVTLIGKLGKDAEIKQIGNENAVVGTIAVDIGYGDKKQTQWWDFTAWRKEKLAQYLTKGTSIFVEGEPSFRAYKDKSGEAKPAMSIRVSHIELLGGGQKQEASPVGGSGLAEDDGSLPF